MIPTYLKMPKKPETVEVSDLIIAELRRSFFEKLDRDNNKIPGKCNE